MSRRGQRSAGDEASSRSPESLPDTVGSPARSPEDVMIYVRTCVLAASRLLFGAAGSRRGISRDSARFNSGGARWRPARRPVERPQGMSA